MIVLGIILLIAGFLLKISILWTASSCSSSASFSRSWVQWDALWAAGATTSNDQPAVAPKGCRASGAKISTFCFARDQPTRQLRRGVHTSVYALEKDIRDWITNWNENPKPFIRPRLIWTKTADDILERLASYRHGIPGAAR